MAAGDPPRFTQMVLWRQLVVVTPGMGLRDIHASDSSQSTGHSLLERTLSSSAVANMSTGKNVRNPCCSFLFTMVCVASTFLLGTVYFHFEEASTSVSGITYFWQTEPIVSINVPYEYQEGICGTGYEPVSFDYIAIQSLSPGPCGCAQNRMSYYSEALELIIDYSPVRRS